MIMVNKSFYTKG